MNTFTSPACPAGLPASFDDAGMADFLQLALSDPRAASRRLAHWCDQRSNGPESSLSDDAATLDDVADGDLDAVDWLAVVARKRPYPLAVRMAFAAVVAGSRARRDDMAA